MERRAPPAAYLTGSINLATIPDRYPGGADQSEPTPATWRAIRCRRSALINAGQPTSILIGAPGYTVGSVADDGAAYLIPGRASFTGGPFSLLTPTTAPLSGLQFTLTTPSC